MNKKIKRRRIHRELDEAIKTNSKQKGQTEMEFMKELGMKLKKKKKKGNEWGFEFRV
tara:strand:- start:707 stop:877 length:171 start_codon:yes stop_codon:yes gene_type:complete